MIALDALPLFEAEARKRIAAAGASAAPGRPAEKGTEVFPGVSQGESRNEAAVAFNVNAHYVSDAKRIAQEAPERLLQRLPIAAFMNDNDFGGKHHGIVHTITGNYSRACGSTRC